jgi:hypothetical protein
VAPLTARVNHRLGLIDRHQTLPHQSCCLLATFMLLRDNIEKAIDAIVPTGDRIA